MWIERICHAYLKKVANMFPAVLMTGPRQVGKTSLLRKHFPDIPYITLDIPSVAEMAEKNPDIFLENTQTPVILDEIQYAPTLFRHLKIAIDRNPIPGQYLLTGSQHFQMMEGVTESLSGRCGILTLSGLSIEEILPHYPVNDLHIMMKGGYPKIWADQSVDHEIWYANYLVTYLERDIRNILKVGQLRDFERFLRSAAIRTGQLLSFSELARDVGIAVSTAKQWMSVLQASGQVIFLEPYHKNLGKRIIKTPKIYFTDTGLVLYLCGIETLKQLLASPLLGAFYETFVVSEIIKTLSNRGKHIPLWFWRNQSGKEIDIVVERGGVYYLSEIKFKQFPSEKDLTGIRAFIRMYGEQHVARSMILCRTNNDFLVKDTRITNIMHLNFDELIA